jgi:hypothetical protein
MSGPELSLWIIAIAVGFFAAVIGKNPTALALVLAFAASQLGLPHEFYAWPDAFTIFVIIMKHEFGDTNHPFPTTDRFILLSVPVSWVVYILEGSIPYATWWWSLTLICYAQFAAAGAEPFIPYMRRRYAEASASPPSHGLMLAYPGGRGGG